MITHIVALEKPNGEQYVFFYDNLLDLRRQMWRFAADPELSFTYYDAACLYQQAMLVGSACN